MKNRLADILLTVRQWFAGLDKKKKILTLSGAGGAVLCIAAVITICCVAAAHTDAPVASESGVRASATETETPKPEEEAAAEAEEETAAAAAESPAAAAETAAPQSKASAAEASAGLTGESSIAANAATSGGTDVAAREQANEKALEESAKVVVPKEEQRIVATSAAACDIMDRLGIDLVGVPETTVSAVSSRYANVTRVGSPMEPDMEIIKHLKPTDVIGPDTLQADLEMKYNNIGVHSTFINLRSVEGLYESVRLLGRKYGKDAEANEIISEYNEFMANYSSGHEGQAKPKVLVLMGLPGSYLVATQNSYAGSLVELAGGENVFHHDSKDFITVNTEAILATDPDVIIRTAHGLPEEAVAMFNNEFSTNDIWKHFRAVKNGRVYDVDYMLFGMSATFDYPQALADLEPMLYGD